MSLFPLILQNALPWLLLLLLGVNNAISAVEEYQTYIIHLDHSHKPETFLTHESWHRPILNSLLSSPADDNELLFARLTPSQLSEIEKSPAHLATYPESFGKLLTTYTPKFLGLKHNSGISPTASYGEDCNAPNPKHELDTWKGTCENGTTFSPSACNRKLIGARSFTKGLQAGGIEISKEHDFNSARDYDGHGTHTASTAVGNAVPGVSHFGYARGTARGMAPGARLAIYKVLWKTNTIETAATDILAGMEQAILDGVDIMSLSLGLNQTSYFTDVIAIASLSAIEVGIFVVCAASNDYFFKTVYNGAPWITTVGAGTSYFPESVYITDSHLYYGKGNTSKAICNHTTLDRNEVAGKVVLCDYSTKINVSQQITEVKRVGAYAAIFLTDKSSSLFPNKYSIPSLLLPTASGTLLKEYVTKVRNPKVKEMNGQFLLKRTEPNHILAPGVDVLAAFSPIISFIRVGKYHLASDYALLSGTSMATPIWSPAAVRSAMMTTAYAMDNTVTIMKSELTGLSGTPLEFGAGHINPNKAMDPGLIYDMGLQDYIEFVCGLGYTKEQMSVLIRRTQWSCNHKSINDLNYPSITAVLTSKTRYPVTMNFSRVVTNVGNDTAAHRVHLENIPTGMRISNRSFVVSIELDRDFPGVIFGFLKWIDQDSHIVSSPMVAINF
ncbi:subtilisin-like protease SBT1.8 [Fagus crenata]